MAPAPSGAIASGATDRLQSHSPAAHGHRHGSPGLPYRLRCAGRFPFPVCRPYGFLPHFTLLLWLQGGQGAELALIDWLDFTRGS
jgi:hypothetical protein